MNPPIHASRRLAVLLMLLSAMSQIEKEKAK